MELQNKKIRDFAAGDRLDGFFILKKADLKTTNSNDKKYLDFIFGDITGEISAKLWDVSEAMEDMFRVGMLVKVRGTVTSYQNTLQFKVDRIRVSEAQDNVEARDFVVSAPLEPEFMFAEIRKYAAAMKNTHIRGITLQIMDENKEKLMYYPAAKRNHHSIRSGLLYHVLTMLRLGERIAATYEAINTDILYAGIILHDMEKLNEMDASELGIVSEYTVEGTLLGHITQGIMNIERVSRELGTPKEIRLILEHMILSHHYEPEYGSPVKPMILEAEILHHIDMIDARVFDITNAVKDLAPGEFSESIFSLERRRMYKPDLDGADKA
ncbi:MAG TPA: OB-fold nucleic acid binding domain-containing protein [Clostridiaceae bacterium]|nr:OB-fold nucleic acid binding domain-containing protein [Clostridiaceae bacterium]